jgi:hypothetical protein
MAASARKRLRCIGMEFFPVPNLSGFRQMQFNIGFTHGHFESAGRAAAHQRLTMAPACLSKINAVGQISAQLATW